MYMSYCRFEGTRSELNACLREVEEHINEEAEYEVSENEIYHFRQMVYEFYDFLQGNALLDEYGDIDEHMLEEVCESMAKSYEAEEEGEW